VTRSDATRRASASGLVALLAATLALPVPDASAHNRSISHSTWKLDARGADVEARFAALDLSQLPLASAPDPGEALGRYATGHLQLLHDGTPCPVASPPREQEAPDGWRVLAWRVECGPGVRSVRSSLLLEVAPSHLHFARVRGSDGALTERVLAEGDGPWLLGDAGSERSGAGTSFAGYVLLGIEHIVSGWDHLAFVAALLLLARTLREVATLVTAFTLAHSVTLALAVLGLVHTESAGVESLIGFSIALVAAENAWLLAGRDRLIPALAAGGLVGMAALAALGFGSLTPLALLGLGLFSLCHFALLDGARHPGRLRAAVAFAFGLVHGFGFAGVLAEMALPADRLVPALVGFNLGVEAGQLAVVALLWPPLRLLARRGDGGAERLVAEVGSAAICGLGLFWFLTRALG